MLSIDTRPRRRQVSALVEEVTAAPSPLLRACKCHLITQCTEIGHAIRAFLGEQTRCGACAPRGGGGSRASGPWPGAEEEEASEGVELGLVGARIGEREQGTFRFHWRRGGGDVQAAPTAGGETERVVAISAGRAEYLDMTP
jgi:hypothetical protein